MLAGDEVAAIDFAYGLPCNFPVGRRNERNLRRNALNSQKREVLRSAYSVVVGSVDSVGCGFLIVVVFFVGGEESE